MSDKEIIRYAFLSDYVKESSEEEIINKLIELDDKQKEKDNKIKQLESVIDEAIKKIQLLIDIGFDYDGYRQADSLMTLIDELVSYAKESREILRSKE